MKYSESQSLVKMAAYCSKAERAESDVRRKLQLWELEPDMVNRVLARLRHDNYLNDERFCRCFIKDKLYFNKWGRKKITFELKKKQIPEFVINSCFEEFKSEDFEEPLLKILKTKVRSVKAKDDYEKRTKLIRFALGRGYSYEQIQKCLTHLLQSKTDDDNEYFESFP